VGGAARRARPAHCLNGLDGQGLTAALEMAMEKGSGNADLVAHPSRNEILSEHGHSVTIAPFAAILQSKHDRRGERVFGKKML
jgi:hypothetical protein